MASLSPNHVATRKARTPPDRSQVKDSAVLMALYPGEQGPLHTVFMLRPDYEGVHSRQIGLPGGSLEDGDGDFSQTALREAEEELGIPAGDVEVLGRMSEVYIPPSGHLVRPFIGFLQERPTLRPDPREVEKTIEMPLEEVLRSEAVAQEKVYVHVLQGYRRVPCFKVGGHVIWGATAMMLAEFRRILRDQGLKTGS